MPSNHSAICNSFFGAFDPCPHVLEPGIVGEDTEVACAVEDVAAADAIEHEVCDAVGLVGVEIFAG